MGQKNNIISNAKHLVIALLIAFCYCSLDWEEIRGREFKDKIQFEKSLQLSFGDYQIEYSLRSLLFNFSNETLWNQGVRFLINDLNVELDFLFYTISFLTIFTFSHTILKYSSPFYIFLLLSPYVIDLCFSQYRMSLAIYILYTGFFIIKNKFLRNLILIISLFIHSASFIFICFYFLIQYLINKYSEHRKIVFFSTVISICSSLVFIFLSKSLLLLLNDRRAFNNYVSSGLLITFIWLYFYIFLLIVFSTSSNWNKNVKGRFLMMYFCIIYFILFSFFGTYGVRFISFSYPLILIAIFNMEGLRKITGLSFIIILNIVYWKYWILD